MALASQTARMTSNRSYMMSNVSRRRRRAQRRNIAVALLVVGALVAIGVYALTRGDANAPPVESALAQSLAPASITPSPTNNRSAGAPGGSGGSGGAGGVLPLSPADASAADTRTQHAAQPPEQATPARTQGALPDPEPIVRRDEPLIPEDAAVIDMGRPLASQEQPGNAGTPPPSTPQRDLAPQQQPAQPTRSSTTATLPPASGSSALADLIARADALVAQNKPLEARDILNRALFDRSTLEADRQALRDRLTRINDALVFSRTVVPGDKLARTYTVGGGDSLAKIASAEKLDVDWRFIAHVNGISDPRRIRVGQSLKLVKGPFHAVVYKSRFRLDLYADATDSAGNRLYIRSFPVGLGEFGSTPVGSFIVRPQSKLINPVWTNPRTGEYFAADNPMNPIGEHWIGLDPANEASASYTQYGLHGTIDPGSIGQEKSMGCVRLGSEDIALLYGLLVDTRSTVDILP